MTARRTLPWIAVALATAIRLCSDPASAPTLSLTLYAIVPLVAIALLFGRGLSVRLAAVLLLAVAIIDTVTFLEVGEVRHTFPQQTSEHLAGDVRDLRARITESEASLDASADRIEARLAAMPVEPDAPTLFRLLAIELGRQDDRGARIIIDHEAVAWWGEDLRVSGTKSHQFDATNLYLIRTRNSSKYTVQVFRRIANLPSGISSLHPPDDWVTSLFFHAGYLRQESGAQRYLIEQSNDSTLYVDLTARSAQEVIEETADDGRGASAALLALGALAVLALLLIGERHRAAPITPALQWLSIGMIVLARLALLRVQVSDDPWHIFHFDVYASRILGPFSRSPFDLLASAAALFGIVIVLTNLLRRLDLRLALPVRLLAVAASAYGYVAVVRNLVDNSRISSLPEHIVPTSTAQGVLLGALLCFGFALLQLARHEAPVVRTLITLAIVFIPVSLLAYSLDHSGCRAYLFVACSALATALLNVLTRERALRLLAAALVMVFVVWAPVQQFERASARRFIADTYAPLVVGEAGQLRTMIEDTLHNEFSRTELSSVLPDEYHQMNLDDLAYALWLRSDLSKWRVPAVITITDVMGHAISRFGVGLPQFTENETVVGREVLQVGSVTRVLIHHDFQLTTYGLTIASGSVHVVNPADPGATSFADLYRDFFESRDDSSSALHARSEPVVYDRDGNVHGSPSFRLPQSATWYFARLTPGTGTWVHATPSGSMIYLRRTEDAIYAFPLQIPTAGEQIRRAGSVAIWAIVAALLLLTLRSLPLLLRLVRHPPRSFDFRTRTSLYLTAVVVLPLIVFVLFVRAYLAGRLEAEYVDRGQTALNAAQRVIEDYLSSTTSTAAPEQVLSDEILSWLARVIGHDLHLYRGQQLVASSRRDLFAAHIDSQRLPGDVYSAIVLDGRQLFRAERTAGTMQYVEIYSPINLVKGESYTLALPFIVQGRQIEAEVNDLATTIYMLLVFIVLASIAVAYRIARTVTRPVQGLVAGARGVARGDFDVPVAMPSDPDLGLLVTTFRDMAQSIRRQQNDLRHERDRLQALLENINAAVVVLDGAMHVGATNLAARRLFNLDEPATTGEPFQPPFREVSDFLREHQARVVEAKELELGVDGNPRTFRISIVPLPDGDEEMLIAEDVTEILRSNRLEAWGEMARQVAHEIKNPLTPIQLTAEHLRAVADREDPTLPAVVRAAVDNILRQVVTLRETSREFSDYASLRQVQRKPVDLQRLLEELAASYADSHERGITFSAAIDPSTPTSFSGDARLLRGAVANLIENAFQAAPGGRVRLASRALGSRVSITVEDDGPGVAPELLAKIFDPYFSTKSSGTGLGLAIARKAIEEHGGAVRAENLEPGLRIELELPMR